jgi:L-amino acid N-acyltransferase YncA
MNSGPGASPSSAVHIRSAIAADATALREIYAPFVLATAVSFEEVVPTIEQFAARIARALQGWAWLVAERDNQCLGYAYGSLHRERAAYRWSVEVSAYVHPSCYRQGVGAALYGSLLEVLAGKGFCNAYACITLPNEASVALHRKLGFQPIGVFTSAGRKFGQWHDVAWMQRALRDSPPSG